jgi:hypothetical protein
MRWHKLRKPIIGYEGYEISSEGAVYSYCTGGTGRADTPRKKTAQLGSSGYEQIKIRKKWFTIHRLVAEYFVDGYFEGAVVDHIDGNKLNNNADNLRWITQRENVSHVDKLQNYTNCVVYGGSEGKDGKWFKTLTEMRIYVEEKYGVSGKSFQKYRYNAKAGLLLKKV